MKNNTLFFFKALACVAVIEIHAPFPVFQALGANIARFAVPLFFMISGFFTDLNNVERLEKKIHKRLKSLASLTIVSLAFYLVFNLIRMLCQNKLDNYLNEFSIKYIFEILFFNYPSNIINCGHLWYLLAIVYVYFLLLIFRNPKTLKIKYILSAISLVLVYIFEIVNLKFEIDLDSYYWRNFLFWGYPCFMVGNYLHMIKDKFIYTKDKFRKVITIISVLWIATFSIETYLFYNNFQVYINSYIMCIGIFIISLNFPDVMWLNTFGKKYATYVYIIHYFVILTLVDTFKYFALENGIIKSIFNCMLPFSVLFISYALSYIYLKLKNTFLRGK